MIKKIVVLIVMSACVLAPLDAQEPGHGGLLFSDITKDPFFRKAVIVPSVRNIATSVDNSAHMPPVGDQGNQNSCVGWAFGYYLKTYQEWQDYGWSVTDPDHIFSPSFIYNHINGGVDHGAYFSDAMKVLIDHGCAPISRFPYTASNMTALPSQAVYRNALQYRSRDAYYIETKTMTGIDQLKQYLAAGNVAVLGISLYGNFDGIHSYNNMYCVKNKTGTNRGGHALAVVGYDDTKITPDGTGAFRLINSWGTGFGDKGYFWMSYEAVMDTALSQRVACFTSDRLHYAPTIIASFGITNEDMTTLKLTAGIGSVASPRYTKTLFNFYENTVAGLPRRAFPGWVIDVDLSDGLSSLDTVQANTVFLHTQSMLPITVNSFSVTDLRSAVVTTSTETPKSISAGISGGSTSLSMIISHSSMASATVALRQGWNMISLPIALVEMSASTVFQAAVSPVYGYSDKYTIAAALENGKGYWVRYPSDTVIVLSGTRVERTTIPLSLGWNLVGGFETAVSLSLSTTTPAGILQLPAYGMTDKYENSTVMNAGKSYWVRATAAGVLNIETLIPSAGGNVAAAPFADPAWTKITVGDAAGRTSAVYRSEDDGAFHDEYLLPPLPPAGIFDVRWDGGRSVVTSAGPAMLELHSADYPLSLSVEHGRVHIQSMDGGATIDRVLNDRESLTITNPAIDRLRVAPADKVTSVGMEKIPDTFELSSIYPNPFNPATTIRYSLAEDSDVTLEVFDALGRKAATVVAGREHAGRHTVRFNASTLSSGVYFCRLTARNGRAVVSDSRRIVVLW